MEYAGAPGQLQGCAVVCNTARCVEYISHTLFPNKRWPPKQIAVIEQKTYQFRVWNFKCNNGESNQEEYLISLENNTQQHEFYQNFKCVTENMNFQHGRFDPMHRSFGNYSLLNLMNRTASA